MKFIIIGLGNFGSVLASRLTQMGHEVIGVDNRKTRVDELRDTMSSTICMDSGELEALQTLPIKQVDMIIVAIGENFTALIQTVALLRQLGAPHITARALKPLDRSVLQALGVQRVIFPEQEAAQIMAQSFDLVGFEGSYRIDSEHYVLRFAVPERMVGATVGKNELEDNGLRLMTIVRRVQQRNSIGITHERQMAMDDLTPESAFTAGDTLVVYGTLEAYNNFTKNMKS